MSLPRPLIIGHRGAAGEAPENTLASFELALKQGAEGIELDVHLSKDGEIVVCHDPTLDRTTNGSGWIFEAVYADIRKLDAGSWFDERYTGQYVPTLGEVLDIVPDHILINVEIKHSYEGRMEKAVLELLRSRGRFHNVVISSFDHKCMLRLKREEPLAAIGLLYAANLGSHAGYARSLNADILSLHPQHQLIGADDVAEARAAGLRTYPYTANSEADLKRLIDAGVSGIITDYPARLAALLK
ncbi:glycerophosphodiester phosphodiesterase [Paenibacillus chartarius]|uniref:Glycerophosphodiester phosphodiesterase n=1 Tax=Paenibacillus chartarius TaxID=747481 RepID=A0ABV6DIQ0_9BACL